MSKDKLLQKITDVTEFECSEDIFDGLVVSRDFKIKFANTRPIHEAIEKLGLKAVKKHILGMIDSDLIYLIGCDD